MSKKGYRKSYGDEVREYGIILDRVDEVYLLNVSIGKNADGTLYIESNKTHKQMPISADEYEYLRTSGVVKEIT